MDISGRYDGGGVCIDCQHNTAGVNCELCEDGYYRLGNQALESPSVCEGEFDVNLYECHSLVSIKPNNRYVNI